MMSEPNRNQPASVMITLLVVLGVLALAGCWGIVEIVKSVAG